MIPVYKPYLTEIERRNVNECLDATWISSKGEFIAKFESGFSEFIGSKHATTVSNGTVALHLALDAIGIEPGDEIIVPVLTYVASVNTILQVGAKPVFVDSLPRTCQMDPGDIISKITQKTKAIMAVHLYGLPCDMDEISEICKKHKLLLIEDCAEAFGTYYKGRHAGTFGDISTFSFFGNKTITTGEGGMVVANSEKVIERARMLKNQGVSASREYWHEEIAYNYRMTNICAAIGCAQLSRANEILEKKRVVAEKYKAALIGLPLIFHNEEPETIHSFWMCSVIVNDPVNRDKLRAFLKENGVETRPFFPLINKMPHCLTQEIFPVAESLSERGLNLPSYPELTTGEIGYITKRIRDFFNNAV